MIIDNPMFTGRFPYDAEYSIPTDYFCPRCKTPLDYEATVYEWGDGMDDIWLCGECLVDAINSLSPADRAEMANDTVAHTEQQLEEYHGSAGAYADIFDIRTERVEDIA